MREEKNLKKYSEILSHQHMDFSDSQIKIGIVKEKWGLHALYVKTCLEQRVSFKVIDIFSITWKDQMYDDNLNFIVYRPSVQYSPWKDMFDNRIRLFTQSSSIPVFPSPFSTWLWESKLRTVEWLAIHNIPYPKTDIYYDKKELIKKVECINFPIVYKSSIGSGASGVKIVKDKQSLKRIANRCFTKGVRTYKKHLLDKEHGYIILQEYIPGVREWRIIRIGKYYFGFEKLVERNFHSGSHKFGYGMPPTECLDLVKKLGDTYDLKYVAIDIFIDQNNQLFVNEIQPYFGQKDDRELLNIEGESGRLYFENQEWIFEQGKFCQNNLCDLRITEYIKTHKESINY